MDDIQRKHIFNNLDKLIHRTDYDKLSHACTAKGLLSIIMLQNLERLEPDLCVDWTEDQKIYERHKRLFIKITKRGPTAYQELRIILADLKYDSALSLLNSLDDSYSKFSSQEKVNKNELLLCQNTEANILNSNATAITTAPVGHIPAVNTTSITNPTTQTHSSSLSTTSTKSACNCDKNENCVYDKYNIMKCNAYSDDYTSIDLNQNDDLQQSLIQFSGDIIVKPKSINVKKSLRIHTHPKLATYAMKSRDNRGVFFMVNIIDFISNGETRRGAEEDGRSLLYLFGELGFKLFPHRNLNRADFFLELDQLLHSEYTFNTECFVMALMTHGTRDDDGFERVTFHDGSIVRVEEIERYFHNHVCPNLQNKPKVFIFPFCRGNIADSGVRERIQTDSGFFRSAKSNIPQLSDVFICYAASPGFRSHRDITEGSWYIQKFVEMMAEHAHDTSFEEIVKMVQAETAKFRTLEGHLQTANSINMGFNKALYFNPGFYET